MKRPWLKKATRKPWEPDQDKARYGSERDEQSSKVYRSRRWRRLRDMFIRSHPLCEHCKAKGITTRAQHVDHIRAIQDGGDPYAWDNLQSLCISCHTGKTNREKANRNKKRGGA